MIESEPVKRRKLEDAYKEGKKREREMEMMVEEVSVSNEAVKYEDEMEDIEYTKEQMDVDLREMEEALNEVRKVKYEHPKNPEM